jgi:hypothetical protein
VRGPKHVVKTGKTPVLDGALIALMTFSFARVGAAVGMRVEDYFADGKRWAAAPQRKRRQGP